VAGLDPGAFHVERAEVRDGVELAFVREGVGGYPLLLVHGWPETMRIWWRNVGPLADAGFEVIVPDLRGFGQSSLAPDGFYDLAAHARDLHGLVTKLGHSVCGAAGGDLGGGVVQDLGLRFEGFVERQVIFNSILPLLAEEYEAAGLPVKPPAEMQAAGDYFRRQGRDADGLAAELDTVEKRRGYVAQFYGSRFWATPGAFSAEDVDFMTEPFGDAEKLRAAPVGAAAVLRAQPGGDAVAVRAGRPRAVAGLPRAVRGGVRAAGGAVRGPAGGPLSAVGARGRAERRRDRVLSRQAQIAA
jgi:pimeloyl-ACP methyl ester carboxylesterase